METLISKYEKPITLLLCLLLLLIGCSSTPKGNDYRESAFCAELSVHTKESHLLVTAEIRAPRADDLPRDLTLSFHEPNALRGLILTRRDGKILLEFDGISVERDSAEELLLCVKLLLPEGDFSEFKRCEKNGVSLLSTKVQNEKETQAYEIYLDPDTGFPKEILSEDASLQILSFTPLPAS